MKKNKPITTSLLFFILLFCTSKILAQTDSTQNYDELISPTNMEAPGIVAFLSDSSVYIKNMTIFLKSGKHKATLKKERETMTMSFNPKTVAMKVEFADQVKRVISGNSYAGDLKYGSGYQIYIATTPIGKIKQPPMYFDNYGYIYISPKKDDYMKVSLQSLSKFMPSQGFFDMATLPNLNIPEGPATYYGMDVSPKKFPILEWAFVYKPKYFEGNDFKKESLPCKGDSTCTRYTLKTGEQSGSYVLFDSKNRLREIHTKDEGFIIFSYQKVTFDIPDAKDMSAYF